MKIISILAFTLFGISLLSAQTKSIFVNAKAINETRYSEYKGSPYLFDDWQIADIYDAEGKAFEKMELNFNGYSKEIEIRKGNQYIELDRKVFTKIELSLKEHPKVFKKGMHDFFKDDFVEVVYDGKDLQMVKKFRAGITEKEINDVGKTIKIKRFEKKIEYYFIKEGKLQNVKLKKKSLYAFLGHKKEIESYLKKNKLKITKESDLKKALNFYEQEGF